jgi:putative addiction module component (TIGR02574 family)
MAKKPEELEEAVLGLDLEDRAALAHKLLLSLDSPTEDEIERLWIEEAERRLLDLREGRTSEVPGEEVFRRAISAIS